MPDTRKGSKADISGDTPLTLKTLKEELSNFKKQLESDLRNSLKGELVNELTASITSLLNTEIQALKGQIGELKLENERLRLSRSEEMEAVAEEVNRRHEKKKNIIISGLPESSSGSPQERKEEHKMLVYDVAKVLGLTKYDIADTHRILSLIHI